MCVRVRVHYALRSNFCLAVVAYIAQHIRYMYANGPGADLALLRYLLKARFYHFGAACEASLLLLLLPPLLLLLLALFTYKYSICVHFIYDCTTDNGLQLTHCTQAKPGFSLSLFTPYPIPPFCPARPRTVPTIHILMASSAPGGNIYVDTVQPALPALLPPPTITHPLSQYCYCFCCT